MLERIFSKRRKENSKAMVLKNINLVDGLSNELKKDMTIIIKEGKITGIGKDNKTTIPHDANALKLSGKTVIPGLIDAHLHLLQSGVDDFMKPYAESAYKKLKRNSFINLKSGITTVRNIPGGFGYSALKFRDKINEGKILGPRILTSGPALAPSNGYFSLKQYITSNTLMLFILSRIFRAHGLSIDVDSKEEGREVVRKLKRKGVDFIKTVTPGSFIPFAEKDEKLKEELLEEGMKLEQIKASMKPEVLKEIVNEAHKQGLKVAVHTISWPDDFKKAVKV
ncbi:MAG: amidohydrolase family protein [Firmicutes bacterium]|nr:amidohydrolase family protein [Bacillota bacterium]